MQDVENVGEIDCLLREASEQAISVIEDEMDSMRQEERQLH